MINNKAYMWLIAGGITVAVILLCLILSLSIHGSKQFPQDQAEIAKVHGDQCERPRSFSAIAEPQNTWSNFAYFLAGLLVLLRARTLPGILFGANLSVLAFFSGFYHATLRELPQVMDVTWVYAVLLSVIALGMHTVGLQNRAKVPWWVWVIVTLVLMALGFVIKRVLGLSSELVFIVLVATTAVFVTVNIVSSAAQGTIANQFGSWLYLILELSGLCVITALAVLFQLGDGYQSAGGRVTRDVLCNPNALIQPHALWHVLSAAVLLLTYDLFAQLQQGSNRSPSDQTAVLPNLRSA